MGPLSGWWGTGAHVEPSISQIRRMRGVRLHEWKAKMEALCVSDKKRKPDTQFWRSMAWEADLPTAMAVKMGVRLDWGQHDGL